MTDQVGHGRTLTYDGLGQMTRVDDATGTTAYQHDGNGKLSVVTQGTQTRTFAYDTFGRRTKAVNPESGTERSTYDNVGNLSTRTDNRGLVTTNSYDGLDRLSQVTYPDGTPTVTYSYDASGVSAIWPISLPYR